jgi:alanine dehydrogenase
VAAYAFETLTDAHGLPLLAPMSEVAGRAAAIFGRPTSPPRWWERDADGRGRRRPPAKVVVIGLGVAGSIAARGARGLGPT